MTAGKYLAYSGYRNSGVGWIGKIPSDWALMRGKFKFYNKKILNKHLQCMDRLALTLGGVIERSIETNEGLQPAEFSSYQIFEKNDLVFKLIDLENFQTSRVGIVPKQGIMSPAYIRLIPKINVHSKYFYYFYFNLYLRGIYNDIGGQGVRSSLAVDELLELLVSVPSFDEQQKITKFLDHEAAKIDTLIEKQQQLIKLLKEKRQAVISHAVTKGLNPNAKMRDSGVEWLGEVPEGWIVTQLRYICLFVGGGTPTKENPAFWDGEIPWVSPKDMKSDYISNAQDKITPAAVMQSAAKLIDAGAVLIVVRGMILDHSVPVALSKVVITINQDMKALIPNHEINGEYLLYCLKGMRDNMLDLVESSAHGTKCLRTEQFDRMELPLPPLNEQLNIVSQLKKELERIDKLVLSTISMIELAVERRTALISAAVTGKIDVRNWQAPNG